MNNFRDSDKTQLRGTLELISFSGVSIEVKVTHRIIRKIKWMASSTGHWTSLYPFRLLSVYAKIKKKLAIAREQGPKTNMVITSLTFCN